jgi:hypothetical protein
MYLRHTIILQMAKCLKDRSREMSPFYAQTLLLVWIVLLSHCSYRKSPDVFKNRIIVNSRVLPLSIRMMTHHAFDGMIWNGNATTVWVEVVYGTRTQFFE